MKFSMIAALALAFIAPLAHAAPSDAAARDAIQKLARERKVEAFEKSPIPGYYQAVIGSQMLYVSEDGRYILQGTLYDADAKLDLTAMRMARVNVAKLDAYPDAKRIIFAPTSKPKYTVTVFTDIDCGYCRKMHSHIAEYNERGIQVDYLFFPRSGPGTPSFNKAVSVWCAADQKKAFTAAKSGVDPQPLQCDNPIAEEFQLGMQVGVDGTPAVFAPDGSKIGGYLTPDQLQAQLERIAAMNKSGS
ncbi:MAG: DsbC family protein [Dokdonella sp.]|jgi:thiol:disulfide interchange protein DsbC|uniref:DsbC family protein n=1 Tax=Dokdonella sp. TaxID=2291710 RepID=UPI001B66832D|nr:DsbC family protein [Dokdonella sp.]MCC6439392.1 DsbC family protein [Rhodanobacteraceae bacterium]MBK8124457.1 DsbC family protein [Dokdonella sp.]MBP6326837.1 DsbC family protein [Dokdonella sp.]MBP6328411.1 DsbC family protein [Dokdonella sp.]HNV09428.1 DsbC family protein [Dokdonella sp.]